MKLGINVGFTRYIANCGPTLGESCPGKGAAASPLKRRMSSVALSLLHSVPIIIHSKYIAGFAVWFSSSIQHRITSEKITYAKG